MYWLVLISGVVLAALIAASFVVLAARIINAIPRPAVRRWTVILILLAICFAAVFAPIAINITWPDFFKDHRGGLHDAFAATPSAALLFLSVVSVFLVTMVLLAAYGFLPQKGQPYQPRAAEWNLGKLCRGVLIAGVAFILTAWLQDTVLRGQLRHLEARALTLASSMTPAAVLDDKNAAVYYQRFMEKTPELDKLSEEYKSVCLGLDLCACDSDARKQYFEKLAAIMADVRKAAACLKCRFDDAHSPVDLLDSAQGRNNLITAAHALSHMASYEICRNRPAEACKLLREIRSLEDHMAMDPRGTETVYFRWLDAWICDGVGQMVTFCDKIPADDLRTLIAQPLDGAAIARAAQKWEAAAFQMQIAKTYDGRAFDRPEVQAHIPTNRVGRALELTAMRWLFARDDIRAIDVYFPFLTHPEDPAAWEQRFVYKIWPTGKVLPLLEAPSYHKSWLTHSAGWRQLTNCAIAIALYRQARGRWPDAMERLVPEFLPRIPIDPIEEQPYTWKNINDGIIVYTNANAKAFENFTDTRDTWLGLRHEILEGELFLGRAGKQLSAADYEDPNNPCAGERSL